MEIENEKDTLKDQTPTLKASSSLQSLSTTQLNYLSQILGIKINPDEISLFSSIDDLSSFINSIKFPDKKRNETKDGLIEIIKSLNSEESTQKSKEEKNKKFSECVKTNGKTIMYSTAEKDELSPTMHAFYFCDKSKQILSDKDAAEFKNMTLDPVYPHPFIKDNNEDNSSYNSGFIDNPIHNTNKHNLGKKRKGSSALNNQKSIKKKKVEKNNEEFNEENGDDLQEDNYCILKCLYRRKSKNQPMIMCDKCKTWYHTKCLGFTNENLQKYAGKEKAWFCPDCTKGVKSDNESQKNSEELN